MTGRPSPGRRQASWALLLVLAAGSLSGCVGPGLMAGLALAGNVIGAAGGDSKPMLDQPYDDRAVAMAEAGDHAQALAERPVLDSCRSKIARTEAELAAGGGLAAPAMQSGRSCQMRPICFPGAAAPMTMLVCETP